MAFIAKISRVITLRTFQFLIEKTFQRSRGHHAGAMLEVA